MTKFKGVVGYVDTVETKPGVFEETVTEKNISGEILRNSQSWQGQDKVNSDFALMNRFSFIGDAFMQGNLSKLRYVTYRGEKWKVTSVEINHPRVNVLVSGVYNG